MMIIKTRNVPWGIAGEETQWGRSRKKKKDNSHGLVLGDVAGNTTNESANGLMPQHKTWLNVSF